MGNSDCGYIIYDIRRNCCYFWMNEKGNVEMTTGFTKKSVDKYIRNRIKYWIYDLGRNAHLYLKDDLALSTNDSENLTDDDKQLIKKFQEQVRDSVVVTGGAFTSMLQGEEPNDLDIYFNDAEVAIKIANFCINKMKILGKLVENDHIPEIYAVKTSDGVSITIRSMGIAGENFDPNEYKYFEAYPEAFTDKFFEEYKKNHKIPTERLGKSYDISFMTSNAITLNNGLQIIIRFTGDPETIHSNFDFIHATNYWTWEEGVVYNVEALRATAEKRLYYFGSKFPVATIFRLKKFIERGWRISAGEIVKILFDVSKLDLTDVSVLREQSMGMDSAYFHQAIGMLINRTEDLDRSYLFKVLDQVFNMSDPQDDFLDSIAGDEEVKDFDLDNSSSMESFSIAD